MKGIILAGGSGTRLYPLTKGVSKQLLAIYDKPMVYYPLSILMLSGIKEILIISTPYDINGYKRLLGNGKELGIKIFYEVQEKPKGLAQAFILGEDFIGDDPVALILGDNLLYGDGLIKLLKESVEKVTKENSAQIFGYYVSDPKRYGIAEIDNNKVISIEEKPINPKSNFAVIGLYFYPNEVVKIAKSISPSKRGELEITSVNQEFLDRDNLAIEIFGRGFTWLDTGTIESLVEASNFIKTVENRNGLKIACLEEIAYNMGYISSNELKLLIKPLINTPYGIYLQNLLLKK